MDKNKLITHKLLNIDDIKELKEEDLLYVYEDNDGDGYFYMKTPHGFEIYECESYDLKKEIYKQFPEWKKSIFDTIWNEDKTNYSGYDGKYKCIYAGHGASTRIDKSIYNIFADYCKKNNLKDYMYSYELFDKFIKEKETN